ncbi:hypothetical protein D9615_005697 [Tricholomella constricta]|uniref:Major facilitator superfamily (MFS) profile domain-containing protein n=1 Tax=Tricholomella constricta TaxID=117010 RepID=A0A8H5HAP2_9AGAR|nr:hypothetical protein D9615_005697 [Tricholomella constricta]
MDFHDAEADDRHEDTNRTPTSKKPFPVLQLTIIWLIQFAEPVSNTVIYPFINQFVGETGVTDGDETKTGYYAGIIESAFFFAECLSVYHWGRLSDKIGRRPVLLLGPLGLAFAMVAFGLSRNFWMLVVSRCAQGVFNGNIGVTKSVMIEITDPADVPSAFGWIPAVWSIGITLGPVIGGALARPASRWPGTFGQLTFFHNFPYFLPCAAAGAVAFGSYLYTYFLLRESLPSAIKREIEKKRAYSPTPSEGESTAPLLECSEAHMHYGTRETSELGPAHDSRLDSADLKPPPFRALLTRELVIAIVCHGFISFLDQSHGVLLPLMLSTSIPLGGLGFDPYTIGMTMGTWGLLNAGFQLVSELDITGGDERKVGYYAGLIESLFFATEAATVLQWSRISDHVGRKPILLIGLFGLSISMLSFGLSRTFWGLVVSRCLCGLLNGNIGVMKSVMGELTDSSNRAEGFSLMPVVWAAGVTLGPLMGGSLSKPAERFPNVFGGNFWKEYPYFLPCIATSSFVFIAFTITLLFFKETVPKRRKIDTSLSESSSLSDELSPQDKPVPLRQLLVYPVIISVSNYMSLAFLNISLNALLPLFLAMPLEIGGLGFEPAIIGYIMGSYGAFCGLFQALYFAKIIHYLGERRIFVYGIATYLPVFALFPIMSISAQQHGVTAFTWTCIAILLALMAFMDMAFGCIFMFITASAPSKRSLGATNGLSQTTVSIARAIGPAMATSLFSVSVEHNLMGGYAVYAILFVLSCFAIMLARRLPHQMWEEADDSTH